MEKNGAGYFERLTYLDYCIPFHKPFERRRLQTKSPKVHRMLILKSLHRHREVFHVYQALLLHMVCTLRHLQQRF